MKKTSDIQRVEKHIIKSSNKYFSLLMDFCHRSKNLYNHANYLVRKQFFEDGSWLKYNALDKLLKQDTEFPDYKSMPTAQSAQQTLRLLDKNWKSFFKSIKDWSRHKEKYHGRPKPPKFLKKTDNYLLVLTNQNCKHKDDRICFPKAFNGFTLFPKFTNRNDYSSFQQIRFIPHKYRIVVEIVYSVSIPVLKSDNGKYIGIDIGVSNLAAVSNNIGVTPFIINGRPVKSINRNYNKQLSHYKSVAKMMNNQDYTKRMDILTEKRNAKISDYMHKSSRKIISFCMEHDIHTIIIGKNSEWKQNSKLSKKVNQHFVQIPFARFIEMIQYKAEECGIAVILTEESYTSDTSFIDNELPTKENYNKSRRVYRGLFKSNSGTLINADLNGAYQIIKKVFPIKWDSGCALHPIVVNIA